ncbi:MAG: hypothetical protein EBQ89_03075 [Alphaproteobacteria bacterium]|nr:hypothetical protein [Alphaproteobacteria bacterium]
MAKISKNNIYAIKYLFSQNFTLEQIAAETNLSIDSIQAIVESENLIKTNQQPTAKDLMINKTAVKKNNTVAIMTQEASMMNDHNKTKLSHLQKSPDHIFKPFNK